ncbi:hypothetical protein KC322_g69 [Hortaea werneckii]|nr:hypothetical protein KC322_g69 [Hortaea werneckii]
MFSVEGLQKFRGVLRLSKENFQALAAIIIINRQQTDARLHQLRDASEKRKNVALRAGRRAGGGTLHRPTDSPLIKWLGSERRFSRDSSRPRCAGRCFEAAGRVQGHPRGLRSTTPVKVDKTATERCCTRKPHPGRDSERRVYYVGCGTGSAHPPVPALAASGAPVVQTIDAQAMATDYITGSNDHRDRTSFFFFSAHPSLCPLPWPWKRMREPAQPQKRIAQQTYTQRTFKAPLYPSAMHRGFQSAGHLPLLDVDLVKERYSQPSVARNKTLPSCHGDTPGVCKYAGIGEHHN